MVRFFCLIGLFFFSNAAHADYEKRVETLAAKRSAIGHRQGKSEMLADGREALLAGVDELAAAWLGTKWGLGTPQNTVPGPGQINCGTFVGRVLHDAGFRVDVKKLQRQPSQLIIQTFLPRNAMKKFSNASMETFLETVREMGPGLYIIGLDFHVGFLRQTDNDVRFVHASYITGTVVDEPAAEAVPITTSKYRVVGKILTDANVGDWLSGRRLTVLGDW